MAAVLPGTQIVPRAGYQPPRLAAVGSSPKGYGTIMCADVSLSIATIIFGDASLNYKRTELFRYAKPNSPEDARRGKVCSKTGFWAPGHRIVHVGGRPYIDRFAPRMQPRKSADWLQ